MRQGAVKICWTILTPSISTKAGNYPQRNWSRFGQNPLLDWMDIWVNWKPFSSTREFPPTASLTSWAMGPARATIYSPSCKKQQTWMPWSNQEFRRFWQVPGSLLKSLFWTSTPPFNLVNFLSGNQGRRWQKLVFRGAFKPSGNLIIFLFGGTAGYPEILYGCLFS